MKNSIAKLFQRDLKVLYREIEAYKNEVDIWKVTEGITNSGGNLALHLVGNLKTYIGKNLGGIAYIRNREAEFSSKNIAQAVLLNSISETEQIVLQTLDNISANSLSEIYPEEVLGYEMTTEYFLIHLHGHLTYHLGQINYHRRILQEQNKNA
ncbi:DUF1572 family protein [Arcicella rigui]|uniref:DUF1572 family protein n=1 Tax=Arcicella rigui TaxID=797020 RepID=A0ABU5Q650_9BACT|nr:DUF1572 family protein [Arcicella rigui]MEA5138037.1 DUF1572 family protein [Arcicella rigui]